LCSDVGNYDRVVIQEILKEIAATQQIDLNAKQRFKGLQPYFYSFRRLISCPFCSVVIINEADSLTRDAQAALRRTMEKYMTNMRLILCANSTGKLIAPIKSRCLLVRVAAPKPEEVRLRLTFYKHSVLTAKQMHAVLAHVAKKEKFDLPPAAAEQIISDANGNMRKAILVLEALKMQSYVPKFKATHSSTDSGCQTGPHSRPSNRQARLGDLLSQGSRHDRGTAKSSAGAPGARKALRASQPLHPTDSYYKGRLASGLAPLS